MDNYIQITKLNDFYFCPASLFLRNIYNNFEESSFYGAEISSGKLKHSKIDSGEYSTKKSILQGLPLYSQKYNLVGKADLVDTEQGLLIERKSKVKQIYKGYIYQLYAQYFCLVEKGFNIKKLVIRSLSDNKNYYYKVPNKKETKEFEDFLNEVKTFTLNNFVQPSVAKCQHCIYKTLCPYSNVK